MGKNKKKKASSAPAAKAAPEPALEPAAPPTEAAATAILASFESVPPLQICQCADCGSPEGVWASVTLGVQLCIRCAGVHRSLGVHVSRVKSISLDEWSSSDLASMRDASPVSTDVTDPAVPVDELTAFICKKYGVAIPDRSCAEPGEKGGPQPTAASTEGMRAMQGVLLLIKPWATFVKPKLRPSSLEAPSSLKAKLQLVAGPQKTVTKPVTAKAPHFFLEWAETMSASVSSLDTELQLSILPEGWGKQQPVLEVGIRLSDYADQLLTGNPVPVCFTGSERALSQAERHAWEQMGSHEALMHMTMQFHDLSSTAAELGQDEKAALEVQAAAATKQAEAGKAAAKSAAADAAAAKKAADAAKKAEAEAAKKAEEEAAAAAENAMHASSGSAEAEEGAVASTEAPPPAEQLNAASASTDEQAAAPAVAAAAPAVEAAAPTVVAAAPAVEAAAPTVEAAAPAVEAAAPTVEAAAPAVEAAAPTVEAAAPAEEAASPVVRVVQAQKKIKACGIKPPPAEDKACCIIS